MILKVKKLNQKIETPHYRYPDDSGFDLSTTRDVLIPSGKAAMIGTGIAVELPPGTEIQVRPRSSMSAKSLLGHLGTVDGGYRGEIKVVLTNFSSEDIMLAAGDRIAQAVVAPVIRPEIVVVENLSRSERGSNGFGSTGKGGREIVENLTSKEI